MTSSETHLDPQIDSSKSSPNIISEKNELFSKANNCGESILYETIGDIVRIAIFAYANYDESCELIGPGKLTIILYPTIEEIRVILQPRNHLWPVRNERIQDIENFDYIGWFWREDDRDRMCKNRQYLGDNEREKGFVFGDWNYYGISFGTEDQVFELRDIIRCIQSGNTSEIPKNSPSKIIQNSYELRLSRFWCFTGLRASNYKVLGLYTGSLWRINASYSVEHDRNGTIAFTSKKDNKETFEMIVIFRTLNGDDVEDIRKCYKITSNLKIVSSHITPDNKNDSVWEWIIEGETWAFAFSNDNEVKKFKQILDSHFNDVKKTSKKFFNKK